MRGRVAVALLVATMLAAGSALAAQGQQAAGKKKLTLERLYQYPRLEGTPPTGAKWSPDSRKVAFLWNRAGMRFRDLWVYDAESGQLTRLTELDHEPDEWTTPPSHKDPKLKQYLPPEGGLRSFEWAPDSQKLAFAFRGELYVIQADGTKTQRLTKSKQAETRPKFSPDSHKLAFTSGGELWVLDLRNGQRVQLTSGGGEDVLNGAPPAPERSPGTFKWSPDGQWIAFQQIDRRGTRTRLIPNYSGVEVKTRKQRRTFAKDKTFKVRLGVVPAAGGAVVWLTKAERQYYRDWEWAPDGTRIAINRVGEKQKKRHLDIVNVSAALEEAKEAGEANETKGRKRTTESAENAEKKTEKKLAWVRTIYSESDDKWICTLCNFVEWSPDSKQVLFSSERDGWNHLYLIAADAEPGAEPRQLTRGPWEVEVRGAAVRLTPRFSRDGKSIYFTANKEDLSRRDLYAVAINGGEPARLTEREGYNAAVVSPDSKHIALLFSSFAQPWDLYVGLNTDGRPMKVGETWQRVTTSPLPEFADYDWPQPEMVEFPARDGKTLRALLFQPTELAVQIRMYSRLPGRTRRGRGKGRGPQVKKVPVVNFVHGAGYAQAVLNRWGGYNTDRFHFNQFLAQHGYAVIDVDYRGSSGYGRDWRTDVYLHLGGLDLQDELAAMDYLKRVPYVDTARAGIWGVSYGGFMTLMALFRAPDVFQVGSAWAAVTDWENYQRHYTQQRLRTPEEEPEAYRRSSPLHHVAGLKNHLQIQHGMADSNVHFQDAVQLMDALVAAGKRFDLVLYPQSSHGWSRPEVWLHSTRAAFEFFETHLKKQ
ncbi:MAG: S9 family peptidase [Acidobacteria bacterium]|nr:S9 family peptidase [Acidobacteriota bacterium]